MVFIFCNRPLDGDSIQVIALLNIIVLTTVHPVLLHREEQPELVRKVPKVVAC